MSDVSMLQKITRDLLAAGYSEEDVANIWGGNMMRQHDASGSGRGRSARVAADFAKRLELALWNG